MSSNLPKEVLEEIYDMQSGKGRIEKGHNISECYQLDQDLEVVFSNLEYFKKLSKSNIKFYLCVFEEIITETNLLDNLIDIIEKNNLTSAKISMSTNEKFKYGTHPLTNIAMWSGVAQRKKIEYFFNADYTKKSLIFSNEHFDLQNKKVNENRKYKSIFSVRRKNEFRDYIFNICNNGSIITPPFPDLGNSICRYGEVIVKGAKSVFSKNPNKNLNDFPTLSELIEEYHNSYISIVCETNNTTLISKEKTPQFSEKSLIAFLSGTMPLIFGAPNLIKNFSDIGLYTWNNYFGFEGDELHEYDKVTSFKHCIIKVSKLSTDEVKKLWIENKDKIQSNVNIISDLINFKLSRSNVSDINESIAKRNSNKDWKRLF